MNYKRKHKKASYRIARRKELHSSKSLKSWEYGHEIAKEILYREEFRKIKNNLVL